MFDHPLDKEMLPNIQSVPSLVQLWTIPIRPITGYQEEELSTSIPTSTQEAAESNGVLFSKLDKPRVLSRPPQDMPSIPSTSTARSTQCEAAAITVG